MNYLIISDSFFLYKNKLQEIIKFEKLNQEDILIFDFQTIDDLQNALNEYLTTSLFEGRKLIVLKNSLFLDDLKIVKEINYFINDIKNSNSKNVFIFFNKTINLKNPIFSILNQKFKLEKLEKPKDEELIKFVAFWFKEKEIKTTNIFIKSLVDKSNNNFEVLVNELSKYEILNQEIDLGLINRVSYDFKGESIFNLVNAFFLSNQEDFLKVYENLIIENITPIQIILRLIDDCKLISFIKLMIDKQNLSSFNISKELSINEFRIKKLISISKTWTLEEIKDLLLNLLTLKEDLLKATLNNEDYLKLKLLLFLIK